MTRRRARRRTARRRGDRREAAADALALDAATLAETRKSLSGADADDAFRYGAETNGDSRRENDARASAHRRMVAMRAETVDRSLLRDPSVCACVLGFSRYRFDPNVPLRAIQILAVLSERNERLLDLLPASAVEALAEGAAGALELASSASKAPGSAPVYAEKNGNSAPHDETEEDAVAAAGAAVLDVILDALPRRAPNVAHALLGFDPALDPSRAVLAPFGEKFTCLTVLLELLEASPPGLCAGDLGAEPPEAAARVLFELVADERTAPACWRRPTGPGRAGRAAAPRARRRRSGGASPADHRRRAAAAHHRAWLLRVAAAALDYCAPMSSLSDASVPFETLDDLPPLAAALARAATRSDADPAAAFAEHADDHFNRAAVEKPRLATLETRDHPRAAPPRRSPPPPGSWTRSSRRSARPPKARPPRRRARRAQRWAQRRFCRTAARRRRAGARGDVARRRHRQRARAGARHGKFQPTRGERVSKRISESRRREARAQARRAQRGAPGARVQRRRGGARRTRAPAGAWAEFVALVATRCLPSGDAARMDHLGPQDTVGSAEENPERASGILFALAEGVLARLASPTPGTREQIVSTANEALRGELADGGGDAWWRALDLPLARLAATLLNRLRDGAEAKTRSTLSGEEEEEESDEGGRRRRGIACAGRVGGRRRARRRRRRRGRLRRRGGSGEFGPA